MLWMTVSQELIYFFVFNTPSGTLLLFVTFWHPFQPVTLFSLTFYYNYFLLLTWYNHILQAHILQVPAATPVLIPPAWATWWTGSTRQPPRWCRRGRQASPATSTPTRRQLTPNTTDIYSDKWWPEAQRIRACQPRYTRWKLTRNYYWKNGFI